MSAVESMLRSQGLVIDSLRYSGALKAGTMYGPPPELAGDKVSHTPAAGIQMNMRTDMHLTLMATHTAPWG